MKKTYDCVLRYLFWPQLKYSVSKYVKSCHVCQLTGKPNQVIKPAPLSPIPAVSQTFEHLIVLGHCLLLVLVVLICWL